MPTDRTISKKLLWAGRISSGLAVLFFLDGTMKLWKRAVVVEATTQLGYPESAIVGIGRRAADDCLGRTDVRIREARGLRRAGGRFLTIAFRNQQSEVLLWPGTQGRASDSAGSPAGAVPGPLIIESDDLRKDFERLRSQVSRSWRLNPRSIRLVCALRR